MNIAVRHTAGSLVVETDYKDGSTSRTTCVDLAEARLYATRQGPAEDMVEIAELREEARG